MNSRENEIVAFLTNSNISLDAYELWKQNDVTKRFFLELELQLLQERADTSSSGRDSIEKIAIDCIKSDIECETLEQVLEWKPHELQGDDN